jgi:DNA-directed RNA polymerase specialized sigma24 family protein
VEFGVDVDEVSAALRAIYPDLRRFAAVVAPPNVEPDDLVQESVARVLGTGQWRKIHDLRAYLLRAIIDAAANGRGHLLDPIAVEPVAEVTLVGTYPAGMSELSRLDPMTRGLLYLVEVEDYLVDEAAPLVGSSTEDAERQVTRARKKVRVGGLEQMSTRGEVRGVDAIVDAALAEAGARGGTPVSGSRRAHWRVAAAAGTAIVLVAAILAIRSRDEGTPSAAPAPSTTRARPVTPAAPATFAGTSYGWVFDDGLVRDIFDNHPVALFPMKTANYAPVRVEGGFVAVLADRSLWFAKEESAESVQLDTLVEGVAASPGGAAIAYSTVAPDGLSATLKLVDVASRSSMAELPLDRFARVEGISSPEVLLDTGDGASASAAIWDPTGSNRVTYLDAFGGVGGVGRNVAVLHQGDGTCGALVTVRNDAIAPLRNIDLTAGDHGCDPSRWEFDPSGALVAGFGMIGAPSELRVSVNRFPVAIGTTRLIGAIWVDSSNVAAVDERGHLVKCDVSARCADVRPVQPPPLTQNSLWLIAPRRDVIDDRTRQK